MRTNQTFTCGVALVACTAFAQPPESVRADAPATDWIYVIDTSLTMLGHGKAEGKNIFADVKQAMLRLMAKDVRVGDTVRLIAFDSHATVGEQVFIGSDRAKDAVRARVDQLRARGLYTYIAEAVQQTGEVVRQQATSGRSTVAVIFTDGIDEPPDSAAERIDLTHAVQGFPQTDALFYFINLGTTTPANDLYTAFRKLGLDRRVADHPEGLDLRHVALPQPPPPLHLLVTPSLPPTVRPRTPVSWVPFTVSASRPVSSVAIDAYPPEGITIGEIEPLRGGNGGPHVHVTAAAALDNHDAEVRFVLRPAEAGAAAVEVRARLLVHEPTLAERAAPVMWPVVALAALAVGTTLGVRWWGSPPIEGTLLVRVDGSQEVINLRHFKSPRLVVGRGGQLLASEKGFQLELAARGTRARVERVTATLRDGAGLVNKLPLRIGEGRTVTHNDLFELDCVRARAGSGAARRAVITFQNFKFQAFRSKA